MVCHSLTWIIKMIIESLTIFVAAVAYFFYIDAVLTCWQLILAPPVSSWRSCSRGAAPDVFDAAREAVLMTSVSQHMKKIATHLKRQAGKAIFVRYIDGSPART